MLSTLFWISVHCVMCFLLQYSVDEPRYKYGKVHDLEMPSVRDLDNTSNRYTVDDYVAKVICPANNYFVLDGKLQYRSNLGSIFKVIILSSSYFHTLFDLHNYLSSFGLYSKNNWGFIIAISACTIAYALLCFLIAMLYELKFTIRQYPLSPKELKDRFLQCSGTVYPVTEKRAFQNFAIMTYYDYLLGIEKSIKRRRIVLYCTSSIATVLLITGLLRSFT